jgi:hypothetical protein
VPQCPGPGFQHHSSIKGTKFALKIVDSRTRTKKCTKRIEIFCLIRISNRTLKSKMKEYVKEIKYPTERAPDDQSWKKKEQYK